MVKCKTESYVYTEARLHRGHKIGERVVHVLPKGTLSMESTTCAQRRAEEERIAALYRPQGMIQAPRNQAVAPGWKHPSAFGDCPEQGPRERHEGTARGVGKRW